MKILYSLIILFAFCYYGYCESIQIQTIDPMPGFEKVGGPAFGEPVESYSGQGLVQYVSESKIMINSKMYFIDNSCVNQITSGQIVKASIVKYALNKHGKIINIEIVVQLTATGKIDRIDREAVVVNDIYHLLDLFINYHDINGHNIGHYDLNKRDFVGLVLNKDNNVRAIWYLNGHNLY
jgi:hypothetical protein